MQAFFRRCKAGETPGYPRFKGRGRFETVNLEGGIYAPVRNKRWTKKGLPVFRIRRTAWLPDGNPVSVRITRKGRRIHLQFVYRVDKPPLPPTGACVGLDMGIADTIMTSDGESIRRERTDHRRTKRLQRAVARSHKGAATRRSRVRMLARERERLATRSRNEAHRITTRLVRQYDLMAVEGLRIRNMMRSAKGTVDAPGVNVAAKRGLNREIHNQAWGQIRSMLTYKAEWAGRALHEVNPAYTSQDCSRCRARNPGLTPHRVYECPACGLRLNRDINAAINILRSAEAETGRAVTLCEPESVPQPTASAGVLA